jgi:ubiquinone/menaquinone biosynthesis C-methylase UbiE
MSEWTAETAEWYASKYGEYPTNLLGLEGLEFRAEQTVLDLGCGTACALRHLATTSEATVVGVDPVPRRVELAQEAVAKADLEGRITLRTGGASAIPAETGSANWVLAFDSYPHWPEADQGRAEVRRVLAPGGRFVITKDGGLGSKAKAKELEERLSKAGFSVLESEKMEGHGVSLQRWICTQLPPNGQ